MKNSIKYFGASVLSIVFSAANARAECVATPDCASLGFNKSEADCPANALKCPWDASKLFCGDEPAVSCGEAYKYTCEEYGYTGGVGNPCNDLYASCECDTSNHYYWTGSACKQNCNGYYYSCTGSNESPGYDSCNGYYNECNCNNGTYWNGSSCGKAEVVLEICVSLPYCSYSDCYSRVPSVSGSISQSGGTYKSFDGPMSWSSSNCTDFTVNALEPVTISFYGMRETEEYWVGYACVLPNVSAQAGYLSCEPGSVYDYSYIQATFQPDRYTAKNTVNISYEGYQQYQNKCGYGNAKVDYNCSVGSSYY